MNRHGHSGRGERVVAADDHSGSARHGIAPTPAERYRPNLVVAFLLLGASLVISLVIAGWQPQVVAPARIPWLLVLVAALIGLRLFWARPTTTLNQARACYWGNAVLGGLAIAISPIFGLYIFIGYYEASRLPSRAEEWAGIALTAVLAGFSQTGGPNSTIFLPPVIAAFIALNFGIAALMSTLDRQRTRLIDQLRATNTELRTQQELAASLQEQLVDQAREAGVAEERGRLSREIHDTVAQGLIAIITQLEAASDADDPEEYRRRLGIADAAARDALAEARSAVQALASPRLDDADLPLALDDLLGQWRSATGIDAEFTVSGRRAATGHDDVLIRVAQEALANVARHADAGRVGMELAFGTDRVSLMVHDDGHGFDPHDQPAGHGLAGMRERLTRAGGSLEVDSSPATGTTLMARLPNEGAAA
ncbi:sensor histidine kinase [Enemella sp. A6]|uniref:sensor histidine kinase n=1 Tax=Enemella sp. A6 TaxID=3440152 RepID=UPI003EBBE321